LRYLIQFEEKQLWIRQQKSGLAAFFSCFWDLLLNLSFGSCGCRRNWRSFLLGGAAIKADKHGRAQDAFERAVVSGFVDAALDAAHGVAGSAKSLERRAAFFGFVAQTVVGDFCFFWAWHRFCRSGQMRIFANLSADFVQVAKKALKTMKNLSK
jgi:hypothetical protein